jgi:hypothetical protein
MVRAYGILAIRVLPRVGFSDAQMSRLAAMPAGGQTGPYLPHGTIGLRAWSVPSFWIIPPATASLFP